MNDLEREAVRRYKEFSRKYLPLVSTVGDLIVPNFDPTAYVANDPIEALRMYLDEVKPYTLSLKITASLRQRHFDEFVRSRNDEESGHKFWRESMNFIAEDADKKLKYWSDVFDHDFSQLDVVEDCMRNAPNRNYDDFYVDIYSSLDQSDSCKKKKKKAPRNVSLSQREIQQREVVKERMKNSKEDMLFLQAATKDFYEVEKTVQANRESYPDVLLKHLIAILKRCTEEVLPYDPSKTERQYLECQEKKFNSAEQDILLKALLPFRHANYYYSEKANEVSVFVRSFVLFQFHISLLVYRYSRQFWQTDFAIFVMKISTCVEGIFNELISLEQVPFCTMLEFYSLLANYTSHRNVSLHMLTRLSHVFYQYDDTKLRVLIKKLNPTRKNLELLLFMYAISFYSYAWWKIGEFLGHFEIDPTYSEYVEHFYRSAQTKGWLNAPNANKSFRSICKRFGFKAIDRSWLQQERDQKTHWQESVQKIQILAIEKCK